MIALLRPPLMRFSTLALLGCAGGDLVIPPDEPAEIEVIDGNAQVGSVGMPLAKPVVVKLLDRTGIAIPNRAVTWVVSAGGGLAVPQTSMTNAEGIASATWILGPSPGPNTLEAVVSDVGLVTFSAFGDEDEDGDDGGDGDGDDGGDGDVPPSAILSTVTASPTTIVAGAGTATITVVVLDEAGRPVPGIPVLLRATGEGNSLSQPGSTGPTGSATGTLSSTTPGVKVISATVGGSLELGETAEVTVTAAPAPPEGRIHHFVFRAQPRDVRRSEWFTVEVAMVDARGEIVPVSGIEIYVGLFLEGSDVAHNTRLLGDRFRDTEDGIAVFRLAITRQGRYRFRALSDELPSLGPHGPEPWLFSNRFDVR